MGRFAIRPRRYVDRLDAIADKLKDYQDKGHAIDMEANPNGKMELMAWALLEIERLREKCGEGRPVRKHRAVPVPTSKPTIITEEG